MNSNSYQQCSRCVMDTTDLEITFDEKGVCNHCSGYLENGAKHKYQGVKSSESLGRTVEAIKRAGKGKDYDCIVGVSGGVDSSYLAYIAVQNGLRPLAVHMDNGWNSEKAVSNIRNIAKKLGIDYQSYVLDWEEFKDLQLSFLKASVPEAETPTDVAITAALHYFAAKHKVRYILSGCNLATEGILPISWHYDAKDLKYFKHIHTTFGRRPLRNFPTFGYKKEIYFKLLKRVQMIYLLNSVAFVKKDAMELLKREFDWEYYGGKHYESRYTRFIQSYYLYEKFGIDYRRASLSTQICAGDIDRADAIEQLKRKPYEPNVIESEKQYIAKKLDISTDEFEQILNSTPKWFWDYPNDDRKLTFVYDSYRKIFKKEKLDRF